MLSRWAAGSEQRQEGPGRNRFIMASPTMRECPSTSKPMEPAVCRAAPEPGRPHPRGQAVPFPQLHCGCKREERLGLEAVTGERQQEPARRSLGGQGLRLLIGEQAQIRRMEGGGNAQPLHKQGGVLNVVQVAVGQHDQPHPGPQAGIQQALHVAGIAGVHQDGALLPLHQIAVHIAAGDAADAPHRTTPLRVFPSSPSSCTCTRQL